MTRVQVGNSRPRRTADGREAAAQRRYWATPSVTAGWVRALVVPATGLAWLAVLLIAFWLLGHVARTIVLVALSGLLAFAFTPVADRLARWMPRPLALGLVFLLGVGAMFGFVGFVIAATATQIASLLGNMPTYADQTHELLGSAQAFLARFGVAADLSGDIQQRAMAAGSEVARESVVRLAEFFGSAVDLIFVIILSFYFASVGERIAHWLQTETPPGSTRYRSQLLVAVLNRVVGGYIHGTLLLATITGVLVGAGLAVIGVQYAVLLGVLQFFMQFIPVLGVIITGAAAVVITLLQFHDLWHPALVLGYFVLVHILEADVVGPRIMGRAVGIHPAVNLIALSAGTELFGVWGALFAAPAAGLLQAILMAAWLEFRGGEPQEVLKAVAVEADAQARGKIA